MPLNLSPKPLTKIVRTRLQEFFPKIREFYGENLLGVLVFGSLVRGDIKMGFDVEIL